MRSEQDRQPSREHELSGAIALLREARSFLIIGHQAPDGDCLGSQAGLASILRALGKEVHVFVPDEPELRFEFLTSGFAPVTFTGQDLPQHDVCALVDASELSRCGKLGQAVEKVASRKLVIDHHLHDGDVWWDAEYIDTGASATGLLIHRLALELGVSLDANGLQGIFTALVTDTGWFRYSNTDPETMRLAADLVESGIRPDWVFAQLHQRESEDRPHAIARVLSTARFLAGGRLAIASAVFDGGAPVLDESDEVLDILRAVETVEVVLFLREVSSGVWKLSARSKTEFDVQSLAKAFGGGGHRRAAGARFVGDEETFVRALTEKVEEAFESGTRDVPTRRATDQSASGRRRVS